MPGFAAHPVRPLEALLLPERAPDAPAPREWFLGPTEKVARRLLGSWLVRPWRGRLYGARIVEVEAYLGVGDAAAHSFGGRRTARVEPMYGPGGLLYVFAVYGMHWCANVVAREAGVPHAVLIRAAEHPAVPASELRGPAKFCRALGIVGADSGRDLAGGGEWQVRPDPVPARTVERSARIGVDYAGEASRWPLRFSIIGNPAVSRPPARSASTRSRRREGAAGRRAAPRSRGSARSSRSTSRPSSR